MWWSLGELLDFAELFNVTLLLTILHQIPNTLKVKSRILIMVYEALHDLAPVESNLISYLCRLCSLHSNYNELLAEHTLTLRPLPLLFPLYGNLRSLLECNLLQRGFPGSFCTTKLHLLSLTPAPYPDLFLSAALTTA